MSHSQQHIKRLLHPLTMVLTITIIALSFVYLDLTIEQGLYSLHFREHSLVLRGITKLASGFILIPFLISALWFRYVTIRPVWEERAWFITACIILTGVLSWGLKFLFGRSRPDLWHNMHEYGFYWLQVKAIYWSFPSGHATTILSIAFGLSFLFPRYRILFVSSGLFIALTRVLLGYHYLSDVVAASYFTLLEVLFLIYFLNKKELLTKIC